MHAANTSAQPVGMTDLSARYAAAKDIITFQYGTFINVKTADTKHR